MNSEKLINPLVIKKVRSPDCLWDNHFFQQFENNFSASLIIENICFRVFNTVDFFRFLLYPEVMSS